MKWAASAVAAAALLAAFARGAQPGATYAAAAPVADRAPSQDGALEPEPWWSRLRDRCARQLRRPPLTADAVLFETRMPRRCTTAGHGAFLLVREWLFAGGPRQLDVIGDAGIHHGVDLAHAVRVVAATTIAAQPASPHDGRYLIRIGEPTQMCAIRYALTEPAPGQWRGAPRRLDYVDCNTGKACSFEISPRYPVRVWELQQLTGDVLPELTRGMARGDLETCNGTTRWTAARPRADRDRAPASIWRAPMAGCRTAAGNSPRPPTLEH